MNFLEKASLLKAELDRLRPLNSADESRIMQKFRLDWNYHSNNLEGNSLTYGETKALLLFGITAQGKPLKDHFEITGHNEAIEWVLEVIKGGRPLTESFIRELHKLILKEPYQVDAISPDGLPTKKWIKLGAYKTVPNHVKTKTGEIFYFASPEETPAKMYDLLDWYREESEKVDINPIILATAFHYKFIRIHPFDDGNGRTVRILMNFILMQFGYPPVIIRTEEKREYLSVLEQADAGMIEPFISFIAQNLVHSLEIMIKGAKGESIEEPDDLDKQIALLEASINLEEKLQKTKSESVLAELLETVLPVVIAKFMEFTEKFNKLYLSRNCTISVTSEPVKEIVFIDDKLTDMDLLEKFTLEKDNLLKTLLLKDDNVIYIDCKYKNFKSLSNKTFDYVSVVKIKFEKTAYRIYSKSGYIEKLYHIQPSEVELNEILTADAKTHIAFIQSKIKE
jgi:Fic family protein